MSLRADGLILLWKLDTEQTEHAAATSTDENASYNIEFWKVVQSLRYAIACKIDNCMIPPVIVRLRSCHRFRVWLTPFLLSCDYICCSCYFPPEDIKRTCMTLHGPLMGGICSQDQSTPLLSSGTWRKVCISLLYFRNRMLLLAFVILCYSSTCYRIHGLHYAIVESIHA
jgi:hypothetical protein